MELEVVKHLTVDGDEESGQKEGVNNNLFREPYVPLPQLQGLQVRFKPLGYASELSAPLTSVVHFSELSHVFRIRTRVIKT